jgi:hypothetical protein
MEIELIEMLEELLSITEEFKSQMNSETLRRWSAISARVADHRLASDTGQNVEDVEV